MTPRATLIHGLKQMATGTYTLGIERSAFLGDAAEQLADDALEIERLRLACKSAKVAMSYICGKLSKWGSMEGYAKDLYEAMDAINAALSQAKEV